MVYSKVVAQVWECSVPEDVLAVLRKEYSSECRVAVESVVAATFLEFSASGVRYHAPIGTNFQRAELVDKALAKLVEKIEDELPISITDAGLRAVIEKWRTCGSNSAGGALELSSHDLDRLRKFVRDAARGR